MPSRRNLLLALGGSATAGGLVMGTGAMGTGAFTKTKASRSATIEVVGDGNGLLGLEPNGDYAEYNNDEIKIDIGGGNNGVNSNSTYVIGNPNSGGVFTVTNQGTQTIELSTNTSEAPEFNLIAADDSDLFGSIPVKAAPLNESTLTISPGETKSIGAYVDVDSGFDDFRFTIIAKSGPETPSEPTGINEFDQSYIDDADRGETLEINSFNSDGRAGDEGRKALIINTRGLTLKSAGDARPTLKPSEDLDNVIKIKAKNVTLDGLEIQSEYKAINTDSNGEPPTQAAIVNAKGGAFKIKNCRIGVSKGWEGGIVAYANGTIKNTDIQPLGQNERGDTPPESGIRFAKDSDTQGSKVEDCTIGRVIGPTIAKGIVATNTKSIEIIGSSIEHNTDGIYLQQADRSGYDGDSIGPFTIKNNDISDNESNGIVIAGNLGDTLEVKRNNIFDNGQFAIASGTGRDQNPVENGLQRVDATENWWGSPAGPEPVVGDTVLQNAEVVPWLDGPYDEGGRPITQPPNE